MLALFYLKLSIFVAAGKEIIRSLVIEFWYFLRSYSKYGDRNYHFWIFRSVNKFSDQGTLFVPNKKGE